jgi:hypothetical protein
MLPLPVEFAKIILAFAPLFSKSVFQSAALLLTGAILAIGKRTTTAVLRVMGRDQDRHYQRFHRVFNRAVWSNLAASRILLSLLVKAFAPTGPVVVGLDDTIERRRGAKIAAKGIYRDAVRSSHSHFVKTSGLRWLCMMLLVPIPWASRIWALPFLSALCPSQRYHATRGKAHKKLTDWARQLIKLIRRWLPGRPIVLVADSSFAVLELLAAVRNCATVITRLRLDAALYAPAPPRVPGQKGRRRIKGARLPILSEVRADPATVWQTITVAQWYGQQQRQVEITSGTAVWYHSGMPLVPIRWVLVRDPLAQFEPQAFLCTHTDTMPTQMLEWFVMRWQMEVTFEEARLHLGIETQRQWSDKAIARITPCLFGLYSIITLAGQHLASNGLLQLRCAAWYAKPQATFSDTIAAVRRWLWSHEYFSISGNHPDMIKIPRPLLERFIDSLCYGG